MRATPRLYLKSFRFTAFFDDGAAADILHRLGGQSVPLTAVWSDTFHPNRLWLAQGHAAGSSSLQDLVVAEMDGREVGRVAVFLLGEDGTAERRVDASFTGHRWLPFDLDARSQDVAVEWVVLTGVTYAQPVDEMASR